MFTFAGDDAAALAPAGDAVAASVHAGLGTPDTTRTLVLPAAFPDELLRLLTPFLAFAFLLLTPFGYA